jgi:hypothetical protein
MLSGFAAVIFAPLAPMVYLIARHGVVLDVID